MSNRKPIAGFFASILNLILTLIVLNALYVYAKHKNETGEELNVTEVVVKQTKEVYDTAVKTWNADDSTATKNDTIK